MISTTCFRDLTRKIKIKGLTPKSWFIVILTTFAFWFFLGFYVFILTTFLYIVLMIMEFLDEDIYEILGSKFKITPDKFYA